MTLAFIFTISATAMQILLLFWEDIHNLSHILHFPGTDSVADTEHDLYFDFPLSLICDTY